MKHLDSLVDQPLLSVQLSVNAFEFDVVSGTKKNTNTWLTA